MYVVGFDLTIYFINESDGKLAVSVSISEQYSGPPIIIAATSQDGTAMGKKDDNY